jgi:hypothetical protein
VARVSAATVRARPADVVVDASTRRMVLDLGCKNHLDISDCVSLRR